MNMLHGQSITPELRQAWLDTKSSRIGGSEIAAAIGINSYDSQLRLWLEKTKKLPPKTATPEMEMGNLMEPAILGLYQRRTGAKIVHTQMFYISDTHDYLCATLDGITSDQTNVQVKNVGCQMALSWGPDGSDEIPHEVIVQAQQEMYCSGLDFTHVVALIGGNDLRIYNISRNESIINHIIKRGHEFIERVRNQVYPEPDKDRDQDLVKYLFPGCDGDLTLDETQSADVIRWDQAKRELKQLEKQVDQLKMKLTMGMGEARQARLSNGQVLYRNIIHVNASVRDVKAYDYPTFRLSGEK